jgi:ubiquinone/menaquinone biosynthesis C-methylase UbiE
LGVTPELVQVDWPAGTIIEAFDKSVDMVTRHWAEHPALPSRVLQAEWHDLPVEDAHFEMIVGDGCTTQFPNSAYYSSFFQEMHRVLQPGGALVMRCFLSPESPLTEDIIMRQVKDRQVRHFGALKWQIAMMLTDLKSTQVKVHEVFATFDRLFPVRESLAVEMGWTKAEIDTIDTYRDQESVYTFPTFGTFAQLCRPHFAIHSVRQGAYELADCCPILTLNPVQLDRPGT